MTNTKLFPSAPIDMNIFVGERTEKKKNEINVLAFVNNLKDENR